MKLGTLVTNKELGNGIVVQEYETNSVLVCWYEVKTSPSMVITKGEDVCTGYPVERWYAPSGFGQVFIMSKIN